MDNYRGTGLAVKQHRRRVLQCLLLLLGLALRSLAFKFTARNVGYVAVFGPATFGEAVAGCADQRLGGGQPTDLLPTSLLAHTLAALRAEAPKTLDALLGNLTAADTSLQSQDGWSLWTWDQSRVCRAARLPGTATAVLTIASLDRPCSWRLSYICVEQAFVARQGLTSSLAWYRSYLQGAAAARWPIGLGLGNVRFVSSDLVVGNPAPPPTSASFNNSDAFWSRGPVVSAIYRGSNEKLLALRLLRESDVDGSWSMYANGFRSMDEIVGTTASDPLEVPVFEMYNVGASYSDYIVAVHGCFRSHLVERLFFVTRSGRQYQLGRGFCTHRFREDAPPGGFLAGLAGWYMNTTFWDPRLPVTIPTPPDIAYIDQLRLVWAAPDGAGDPTYSVSFAPTVDDPWNLYFVPTRQSRFCPNAKWLAFMYLPDRPNHCGAAAGRMPVCPSNQCCGLPVANSAGERNSLTCGNTAEACRNTTAVWTCSPRHGLCGATPEQQFVQFVRSPPGREGSNETTLFLLRKDVNFTYSGAVDACWSSAILGFAWSMISAEDALDWTTSLDVRQGAYEAITTNGPFWVAASGNDTAPLANTTCVRVAYGERTITNRSEAFAHTFAIAPCSSPAIAVCKASVAGPSPLAAAEAYPRWAPGPHVLSISQRRIGGGPYHDPIAWELGGASCGFALGAVAPSNSSTNNMTTITEPLTQIAFSMAAHPYNESDEVTTISGVHMRFGSGPVIEAGDESSYGWHTLDLAAGEMVVAVSGCWGGFVERLVLHTSAGRLWTPPFWASSSCSVPFTEAAPAGGYLVGLQGFVGYFIESLQLVWGQPLAALNQPPPASAAQAPLPTALGPEPATLVAEGPTSTTSGRGSSLVGTVGIAVGVAAAVALVVAFGLLLLWWRRRSPRLPVPPPKQHGECDGGDVAVVKQVFATSHATTGTLTAPDASSSHEVGGAAGVGAAHVSYIADVENRLGVYVSTTTSVRPGDGLAQSSTWQRTAMHEPDTTSLPSSLTSEPLQNDIATAISKLQAELSGRQEQLHITSVLGKGSFGVVYLGTWRGLRVAVKTLVVYDALMGKEGRQRHRAILEAAISKSLQHPNVVSTYASELVPLTASIPVDAAAPTTSSIQGSSEGSSLSQPSSMPDVYKLFIIQELCDVGPLTAAIAAGVVGSVQAGGAAALCALTLALDIAFGMDHIHSRSIVHGDLSPSNVLLSSCSRDPNGQPAPVADPASEDAAAQRPLGTAWRPPVVAKVADFGLSVHMADNQSHASNRFQGTPAYAAPEVVQRGRLSKAADVWAYGIILLELCHGQDIAQIRGWAAPAPEAPSTPGPAAAPGAPSAPAPASAAGAPAWAAPPASCPPALASLVAACLALDATARPAFPQVVQRLAGVLRECQAAYRGAQAGSSTALESVTVTLA